MKNSLRNHYTRLIEEKKSAEELLTVLGFSHGYPPHGVHIENITGERVGLK